MVLGLDYFDIYIRKISRIYKPPKGFHKKCKKLLKRMVHYLIQDVEVLETTYSKIPISTIKSIHKSGMRLQIKYNPFAEKTRVFSLEPELEVEDVNQEYNQIVEKENQKRVREFNEIHSKLTSLYEKRSSLKPIKLIY